jgi:HK97 family phage major capsid protein
MTTDIKGMLPSERSKKLSEYAQGLSNEAQAFLLDCLNAGNDERDLLQKENNKLKGDLIQNGSLANAGHSGSPVNLLERELYQQIGEHANAFKAIGQSQKEMNLFSFESKAMIQATNLTGDPVASFADNSIQRSATPNHFSRIIGVTECGTGTISYMRESSPLSSSGSFGFQTEGSAKPEITYNATVVNTSLDFLAATVKISRQFLNNIPDLQFFVARSLAEDYENSLDTFVYQRLWASATPGVSSATVAAEKLLDYTVQIGAAGRTVSHICLSPSSWAKILKSQPGSSQPYSQPGGISIGPNGATYIFGLPLVPIPAMPSGSVLIGNFSRACSLAQNGQFGIRTTDSDSDDFQKNLITLRAENQLALMIYSPASFVSATI